MEKKLLNLIEQADSVLVTSHISPDPDAVSSALLVGRTLSSNYPDKKIEVVFEEQPAKTLDFLAGYDQISFQTLIAALNEVGPDLFIVVDANSLTRISRQNAEEIKIYLTAKNSRVKTVIIDHHEQDGAYPADIFINNKRPATAEEVYCLLFESLRLKKPDGYAETTLLGIISDTDRHKFDHPGYRDTFRIVCDLMDAGASIEKLESILESHSKEELEILCTYISNITDSGKGYTYSFIPDEIYEQWQSDGRDMNKMKDASEEFAGRYLRTFESNKWGFMVTPEPLSGKGWWGVSLRSVSGAKDVSAIARALGGGGHKPAAGAKIRADSGLDAIKKVEDAISGAVHGI